MNSGTLAHKFTKVQAPKNNPYRLKVHDYPGRLFTSQIDEDIESVKNLCAGKELICEIGSGSGGHLLELGKQNAQSLVFGFELRFKRSVRTLEKADRECIENVYVIRKRGENITKFFSKNSLNAVYINFPDPWAKRRTQKNRIMSESFVSDILSLLTPSGFLSFKTDHAEYFEAVISEFEKRSDLLVVEQTRDLHSSEFSHFNIITEFERLFIKQKLPIHYLKAVKGS